MATKTNKQLAKDYYTSQDKVLKNIKKWGIDYYKTDEKTIVFCEVADYKKEFEKHNKVSKQGIEDLKQAAYEKARRELKATGNISSFIKKYGGANQIDYSGNTWNQRAEIISKARATAMKKARKKAEEKRKAASKAVK